MSSGKCERTNYSGDYNWLREKHDSGEREERRIQEENELEKENGGMSYGEISKMKKPQELLQIS